MSKQSLREIALEVGTDKQRNHSYADHYERHLSHLRQRSITLLEIGIGGYMDPNSGGESLRMWKAYFPRAQVVGIDIHSKVGIDEARITSLQGDQSDPTFLAEVAARFGPFDIIIDDGSHICEHVITSFRNLFPHLTDDGIYAIEDLQTSYWWKGYGGSSSADRSTTTMAFLESLVDGLNYAELDVPNYQPTPLDRSITSLAFYHNLAFIQKGSNEEASNVMPAHPRPRSIYAAPEPGPAWRDSDNRLHGWLRRVVPRPIRRAVMNPLRRARALIFKAKSRAS